jgi:hypothetical protein
MCEAEVVRWTITVSKETDVSLRTFLAQRGLKRGDRSKFIERAVEKEVFAQTVAGIQKRNAGVPAKQIRDAIDGSLRQVREDMWGRARTRKPVTSKKG